MELHFGIFVRGNEMAKKKAAKRTVVVVPCDEGEANKAIARVGDCQRKIARVNQWLNDRIQKLKDEAEDKIRVISDEITNEVDGLFAFAQAHRDDLTDGGKTKTVKLPNGELAWRTTPPAVSVRGIQAAVENFERLGLHQFVRTKKEVDKEAVLRESELIEGIKGVSISQREEFVVKPAEADAEIIKKLKKAKK